MRYPAGRGDDAGSGALLCSRPCGETCSGCRVHAHGRYASLENADGCALCRCRETGGQARAWHLPDYVFTKILGLPAYVTPYANADEANHAPNENMEIALFLKGIRTGAALLASLGDAEI